MTFSGPGASRPRPATPGLPRLGDRILSKRLNLLSPPLGRGYRPFVVPSLLPLLLTLTKWPLWRPIFGPRSGLPDPLLTSPLVQTSTLGIIRILFPVTSSPPSLRLRRWRTLYGARTIPPQVLTGSPFQPGGPSLKSRRWSYGVFLGLWPTGLNPLKVLILVSSFLFPRRVSSPLTTPVLFPLPMRTTVLLRS